MNLTEILLDSIASCKSSSAITAIKTELPFTCLCHSLWWVLLAGTNRRKKMMKIVGHFSHQDTVLYSPLWISSFFLSAFSNHTGRHRPKWLLWGNPFSGFQLPKGGTAIWVSFLASAPMGRTTSYWRVWEKELSPLFSLFLGGQPAHWEDSHSLFLHGVNEEGWYLLTRPMQV